MTVLGIDPGLDTTGYAVVESNGTGPRVKEAGVLRTNRRHPLEKRLKVLYDGLDSVIKEFSPDMVSVEKLYSHYKHPQTAVIMGHARGTIFLCAAEHLIPVESYASTKIKKSITGNGRASKVQMQRAVQSLLRLRNIPEPADVADAIAVAVCHIENSK